MARVTYIENNGKAHILDVPNGDSVMQGAVSKGIGGIVGECGGGLACATCHCYVDPAWIGKVGIPTSDSERDMLESASAEIKLGSRLSCQIPVSDELEGLVVHLPASQY